MFANLEDVYAINNYKKLFMSNAERFIEIYNQVDKLLKDIEKDEYQSFTSKIRGSKNPLIIAFREKLIDYAELRNAITHNSKIGGKFIAEPLDEIVKDFGNLLNKLQSPKKIIPLFQFEVVGRNKNDKLDGILKVMKEMSFSQFPVYDDNNRVIEIINTNTISRWIGRNIVNNEIIVENPKIQELLDDIEFKNNYRFIARNTDIYTAHSMFINQIEQKNRNLDAIFITNSGRQDEKLLGLITIEDIASQI